MSAILTAILIQTSCWFRRQEKLASDAQAYGGACVLQATTTGEFNGVFIRQVDSVDERGNLATLNIAK